MSGQFRLSIKEKERYIVSLTRVLGMVFIVLCHLVQESNSNILIQSAQVFNVGVFIFLFISGFLYGVKDITNIKKWYKGRAIRILVPLYIFMIFLFILYNFGLNSNIEFKYYFIYLFNLQGLLGGIMGAQHLWFLTAIMLCYIITPLLNRYKKNVHNKMFIIFSITIAISIHFITAVFINEKLGLYLGYLFNYIFAYYFSYLWNRKVSNKSIVILSIVNLIGLILRFFSRFIIDGTILYDGIIVIYQQSLFSIWIFMFIYFILKEIKIKKYESIINYFDGLSFYIYITHMMFISRPLSVMKVTSNFVLNSIIALILTFITAILLKRLSSYFYKFIKV